MEIKVYDPEKDKNIVVGNLINGTYLRDIKPNHYVFKYAGYGIQANLLAYLNSKGCHTIKLRSPKRILQSSIDKWILKGFPDDLGNGVQVFLPISEMEDV